VSGRSFLTTHRKDIDLYSVALGALIVSLRQAGVNRRFPFKKRQCKRRCKCQAQYAEDKSATERAFFPY